MSTGLRILSFNIRNGEAEDGPNRWEPRKPLTLDTIRGAGADVICLQEVFAFQRAEIAEALPEYAHVGVGREDGLDEGEHIPIFFRRDRFELRETKTFWLSETPEEAGSRSWESGCTRICTVATLVDPEAGAFHVFNVHLDHASEPARANGIEVVLGRMPNRRALLMGDFNAPPSERAIEKVLAAGMVDVVGKAKPELADAPTFHGFDPERSLGDRIDYIFATPDFEIRDASILRNRDGNRYPSDHFPIGANVSFSTES